jgi:CBS domain-containing protein
LSPSTLTDPLLREVPTLTASDPLEVAVPRVIDSGLPALPVADEDGAYCGIFGEREFITALFPGYVKNLGYAAFVPKSLEAAIAKRQACRHEPVKQHMNREHVDVPTDFSDLQLAEIFIHHRVLIIPVTDGGRVCGIVTRTDFFTELAERFIAG